MRKRIATRSLAVAILILVALPLASCFAQYRTQNFVVTAPQPALAKQVGDLAEKYRSELAVRWLGQPLPAWPQPCPIVVKIEANAGGETSFAFQPGPDGRSQPFDWRMKIYGSPERILDSVLPHEITHTIFATHYGRPLPRWADEGACTTVEHTVEKEKNHRMLMQFLTTNRGIPFNHMFAMKQYPHDILPLYAQGYSLVKFLIMQRGHRHFVNFVGEGMEREIPGQEPQTWNEVTKKYYGFNDLSDLQVSWLSWVKKGSQPLARTDVASATPTNPTPNSNPLVNSGNLASTPTALAGTPPLATLDPNESWYVRQSRLGGNATMQRPSPPTQSPSGYAPGSIQSSKEGTVWR